MLEEVGEAGAPLGLGSDADVVDDGDTDDRRGLDPGLSTTRSPLASVKRSIGYFVAGNAYAT